MIVTVGTDDIVGNRVISAGAGKTAVAGGILRGIYEHKSCDRTVASHATDRHIVGGASAGHHRRGCPSRTSQVTSALVKPVTGSLKTTVKLIGEAPVGSA